MVKTRRNGWALGSILGALLLLAAGCARDVRPTLNLFIWGDYMDPEVVREFEREFGMRVIESNFGSNEELLAKLQAGGVGYDVVVPSDYMIQMMRRQGLLARIDPSRIPNLRHLDERHRRPPYDPEHEVSVPFQWGTTGIAYRADAVARSPESWGDLLLPEHIAAHRGRLSMLNDMREAIGAALLFLGHSPNTTDPQQLREAEEILRAQRPFLAKYDSEAFEDSLAAGETVMAQGWSGEIALAQAEVPQIHYILPREGVILWVDNLAVPLASVNKEAAESFINFLLRPDIAARIANHTRYASASRAARPMIDAAVLNGPAYLLPEDESAIHYIEDLGEAAQMYARIWTGLRAR